MFSPRNAQFTIVEKNGQQVEIVIYDADSFGKKQYVGKLNVQSNDIAAAPDSCVDKWYHIYDTTRAKLHLKLTYFSLSDDVAHLRDSRAANQANEPSAADNNAASAEHTALVYFCIDSARNLPVRFLRL